MRKIVKMSIAAAMIMGVSSVSAQAEGLDIVSNVKVKGEIRARYENVDDGNTATSDANALTNRLLLGVSGDLLGTDWLSAYAEMINVSNLNDNYNDGVTANGAEPQAGVDDSAQTRLTQAYLDFKMGKTMLRVGRQMINLDNQRFVGAVGWRQMPQTFDAITLSDSTVENLNLSASYITQINRIFNNAEAKSNWDTRTLLLNGSYKVMPELKVTAYAYMIGEGTSNLATGGIGSDTYGLTLSGDVAVSDGIKVNYRAEYATQTDPSLENSGSNTNIERDADYMNFELGANISGILVGARYEVLSGENASGTETAFITPLATLHGQNGWADKFINGGPGNVADGLEDMSLMVGYKSKDFGTAKVIYHDFSSDVGNVDYGSEIDAVYTRAIPGVNNLTGMLKIADYSAGDTVAEGNTAELARDTTKFWAMLDYKFATK